MSIPDSNQDNGKVTIKPSQIGTRCRSCGYKIRGEHHYGGMHHNGTHGCTKPKPIGKSAAK